MRDFNKAFRYSHRHDIKPRRRKQWGRKYSKLLMRVGGPIVLRPFSEEEKAQWSEVAANSPPASIHPIPKGIRYDE